MTAVPSPDTRDLRRHLRDLAALTALATVWGDADRQRIANDLADVLGNVLSVDFLAVRLGDQADQDRVEVFRTGQGPDAPEQTRALRQVLESWQSGDTSASVLSVPYPSADGSVRAAVVPIGYGCGFGVLVVASVQPGFPSEEDCLLLNVAANQAAIALQRRQAEESQALLAAIVTSSDDAIVSKTLDGVITSWNVGAERLFEYTAAEAVGQSITLIIPPERRHEEEMILGRLSRGERIEHYETVRQSKQGRLLDISLTISPVRDSAGRVIGASKVARDITARKAAEKALQDADRRKDEFLAMLAHELRNPLAPIRNALHILHAKGPPVPELQWARDVIDRQVRQMSRLVDDLLDVSRIRGGKIVLRKERVELASVVSSAVEASRPLIEKWGHELTVTLPPEPVYLEADATRLSQILTNLLNNAAKYTNQGGRIWLTGERQGDAVLVRVKDTGIGIPREMLPHIFEMFTQVERSLERSQGGLGIGLTLVQRLVALHGGTVEAHSDGPGKGSEFTIRLPVAAQATGEGPQGTADDEQAVAPAGCRILVVDDNRDAADTLAMLLRMMGHAVHTAHDGLEAVGSASVFQPDVALLDIGLPKLNGYEVARRVREQPGGDKVVLIALTGWGQEEDRRRSREAGFDYHLTKPVELDALQQLLAQTKPGAPNRGLAKR
jgi:PAS domain S-box-containing protein